MAIIHRVGEPVEKCERRVIEHLRTNLPNSFHVYHNLELPNDRGHPFEYDLIVINGTLVWVVEVKNYRGVIRGNSVTWELANGAYVPNPIPLTNQKARILKSKIRDFAPWLNGRESYVDALIVVCDNKARFRIRDLQRDRVVRLSKLIMTLTSRQEGNSVRPQYAEYVGRTICSMLDSWFGPISRAPRIGDYVLVDSAYSHGDSSVLYPAQSLLLKTRVSLRVYQLDPYQEKGKLVEQRVLALRAANALMQIGDHENIVKCNTPFTWESDKIVLPLEWVNGPTLRDLLNQDLDWPFSRRLDVFRQICEGLAHSHRHGVFHRSLSPENVVIAEEDQVKLLGFDFAKIASLSKRDTIRTRYFRRDQRRYSAPEVRQDHHVASTRSDIYSAGVVLYELMVGTYPFGEEIVDDIELDRLSAIASTCPTDVDEIFLSMCAPNQDERYGSFEEVLQDIRIIA